MTRIGLFTAFLLLLSGCASNSVLKIQPNSHVAIEVPNDMFSSIKMRDGELLFLKNNRIIGFVKSDEIPKSVRTEKAERTATVIFDSVSRGAQQPSWIKRIPDAKAFEVIEGDFRTIFIIPTDSDHSLITFQGPTERSSSVRINGEEISD